MSAPPPPRLEDESRERGGLWHVVTRDLGLKATALLLAIVLWLVVSVRRQPVGPAASATPAPLRVAPERAR